MGTKISLANDLFTSAAPSFRSRLGYAKIRDAETSLFRVDVRRKTNIGFVPLRHAHVAWRPGNGAFGVVVVGPNSESLTDAPEN